MAIIPLANGVRGEPRVPARIRVPLSDYVKLGEPDVTLTRRISAMSGVGMGSGVKRVRSGLLVRRVAITLRVRVKIFRRCG